MPSLCGCERVFTWFSERKPGIRILFRPVDRDVQARDDLMHYSRNAGIWPPGVPTFVVGEQVLVGFEGEQRTAQKLVAMLNRLQAPATGIDTKIFGAISVSRLGLPLFSIALGLLDGFNPCAMWILLFLLSLLVHLHDRKRMALIAGTRQT
jgi:hypothetical protein